MTKRTRYKDIRIDKKLDHIDTVDDAIHHFLENCSGDGNANVQLNFRNDSGILFSVGLCSSGCTIPGTEGANSGGIVLEADANMAQIITYLKDFIFKTNPDDDGDFSKVIEVAKIRANGSFITENGAIKCGPDCPEMQFKKITGTTPLTGPQTYYTGIDKSKILGEETYVENTDGKLMPRNNDGVLDKYEVNIAANGDLIIDVFAGANKVGNRPFSCLICYEK